MKRFWVIGAVVLLAACTNPQEEKVDQLKKEAIAVHDEVMPRMGEIQSISLKLKEIRTRLDTDTSAIAAGIKAELSTQIYALEEADEAMMSWMAEYDPTYEKTHPLDSAVIYYTKEKASIAQVKEQMEQSIEDGTALLEQYK